MYRVAKDTMDVACVRGLQLLHHDADGHPSPCKRWTRMLLYLNSSPLRLKTTPRHKQAIPDQELMT